MATGDVTWFDQALADMAGGTHNINTGGNTVRLGLITSAVTPATTTADPRWGAGGGTNFSTNQVATATAYTGPIALGSVTGALVAGQWEFDAANVTVAQDAGGFTNARWGILYNDSAAGKNCLAWVDLGSDRSIVTGPLTITWGSSILTLNQG